MTTTNDSATVSCFMSLVDLVSNRGTIEHSSNLEDPTLRITYLGVACDSNLCGRGVESWITWTNPSNGREVECGTNDFSDRVKFVRGCADDLSDLVDHLERATEGA